MTKKAQLVLTKEQIAIMEREFGHKEQYDFNQFPSKFDTAIRINPKQWMEIKENSRT